jgi:ATP-binding cassette, subfamily B, multidrug efflux pump
VSGWYQDMYGRQQLERAVEEGETKNEN